MHRVLKVGATKPGSRNAPAQQRRMNRWRKLTTRFVRRRAGSATARKSLSSKASRPRQIVLRSPKGWQVRRVRSNGQIRWQGRKRFVGEAFVGYPVGLRLRGDGKWAVRFATSCWENFGKAIL